MLETSGKPGATHTRRWDGHYHSAGERPLFQRRFKIFPVQKDSNRHFPVVCR